MHAGQKKICQRDVIKLGGVLKKSFGYDGGMKAIPRQ